MRKSKYWDDQALALLLASWVVAPLAQTPMADAERPVAADSPRAARWAREARDRAKGVASRQATRLRRRAQPTDMELQHSAALTSSAGLDRLPRRARRILSSGDQWRQLLRIARLMQGLTQARRDLIRLETMLCVSTLAPEGQLDGRALKRRTDIAVEVLTASSYLTGLWEDLEEKQQYFVESSKSPVARIATHKYTYRTVRAAGAAISIASAGMDGVSGTLLANAYVRGSKTYDAVRSLGLEDLAYALAVAYARLKLTAATGDFARFNELRFRISRFSQAIGEPDTDAEDVSQLKSKARMLKQALDDIAMIMDEQPSGSAPALAPDLTGLRLPEARRSAKAIGLRVSVSDGLSPEGLPGRWRLRPGNWVSIDQWPPPGYYLATGPRVRIWALKPGEAPMIAT